MSRLRHTRAEILMKIGEVNADLAAGLSIEEICLKQNLTVQTLQRWLREHASSKRDGMPRLRQLESENRRLRKAIADLETDKKVLSEAVRGNF
ncbi:MAG: transposase IS3/IS911-family, orfA [Phycisphaerales bacterium]|nr:transposase IS3/IS911-family, orfA [Phycisphaerales bacterium]